MRLKRYYSFQNENDLRKLMLTCAGQYAIVAQGDTWLVEAEFHDTTKAPLETSTKTAYETARAEVK